MAVDTIEVKELTEEIKKSLHDMQATHKALDERGQKNSDGLVEVSKKFDSLMEKVDEYRVSLEGEKAAREQLEKTLARIPEKAQGEDKVGTKAYADAFMGFIKSGGRTPIASEIAQEELRVELERHGFSEKDSNDVVKEFKTMYAGSNPDGGVFIPVDMRNDIVKRIAEMSPVRQLATVIPTGSNMVEYIIDDDLTNNAAWVAELTARTATDTPKVASEKFPVNELYAFPTLTNSVIEDSVINVETWLRDKMAMDFSRKEATAFVLGTGVDQPKGILSYDQKVTAITADNVYVRGSIQCKETATNDTTVADDFIKLQYHLLEPYQANAVWMMNRKSFAQVAVFKAATTGDYLINPRLLFEGVSPQLLGKPVYFSPDMAATFTTDAANIAIYGDIRESYLVIDRIGITIIRDNITTPGFIKFHARKRVGGGLKNFQSLVVLQVQ